MSVQELLDLIDRCEKHGIKVIIYAGDKSYNVNDRTAFIRVWNQGTPEYEGVGSVSWYFNGDGPMSPERLQEQHTKVPLGRKDPRGPKSASRGFTTENTEVGEDYLNVPAPKTSNCKTAIWILCQLSKLLIDVSSEHQDKIGSERHEEFAKKLATKHGFPEDMAQHCILEGLTLAQTDYVMQHLRLHFDRHNDRRKGYNDVICASSTTKDYQKRDAHIGYFKNACGAVPDRRQMVQPALRDVEFYLRFLPDWMKKVTHDIYEAEGAFSETRTCITGTIIRFMVQAQHIDKIVFYSGFVWMLRRLHRKHKLSLQKFLELLLTVGWVSAPEVWWLVMTEYYEMDKLPEVVLSWDYLERAEKYGGVNGGTFRRFQSGLNFEFTYSKVLDSLNTLLQLARASKDCRVSKVQYLRLMKCLVKHLHFVGHLCAQHILHVAILLRILSADALLCQYSAIASGTKTSDKMKERYSALTLVQQNQVLDAVAKAFGFPTRVGENVECKVLKVSDALDHFLQKEVSGTLDESKVFLVPNTGNFIYELLFDEQTVFREEEGVIWELLRDGTRERFDGIGELEEHDPSTTPGLSDEDAWFLRDHDFEDKQLSTKTYKSKKGSSNKKSSRGKASSRTSQPASRKRQGKKKAKHSPSILDYEISHIVSGLRSRSSPDSRPPRHEEVFATEDAWVAVSHGLLLKWARATTGDDTITDKKSFTFWQHSKQQEWCACVKFGEGYSIDGSDPNLTFFHSQLPGCKGIKRGSTPASNGERRICYNSKEDARRALLLYLCIYGDKEVPYRWLHNLMDKKRFIVLGLGKNGQKTGRWLCYFYRYRGRIFMATPKNYQSHRSTPRGPSICSGLNPLSLIGQPVAKEFDGMTYYGKVDSYFPVGSIDEVTEDCWHVLYDDGDEEDVISEELCEMVQNYNNS